jgi:pimeloyl-ACP methyl ester carboxylesterase
MVTAAGVLSAAPAGADIGGYLAELGGRSCPDSEFTCVTLTVPLDHLAPSDPRTLHVVFAVLPATGRSKGLFVTATGGPGTAGVSYADSYTAYFAPAIRRRFDIVFFDQRGIGLSGGLTCPHATAVYYQAEGDPAAAASRYSSDCVEEMGMPAILPYVGTSQAIEDLELFRRAVGSPRVWLYGESYGTQYAQAYAAAHPGALGGLILDGTVDLTLTGPQFWAEAATGFEDVLEGTFAACDRRPRCHADVGGNLGTVYDSLAARLDERPLRVAFPRPSGGVTSRELTRSGLDFVASSQLYSQGDRMLLQRALAAAARGDRVPLMRLLYLDLYVDPETLEAIPDPSYSDGMYYGVDCQDYSYYAGTAAERVASFLADAEAVGVERPRLGKAIFLSDLPCVTWPDAPASVERPGPLRAKGVPTIVLGAEGDPITPPAMGERVFGRLADGYLVTTKGGPHVTFGRGNPCPDDLVTAFLVDGARPTARETACPGQLVDPYVPLAPTTAAGFASLHEALASLERELSYLPEYYYWDFVTPTAAGCPAGGGTILFRASGSVARLTFRRCGFTRGFVVTGTGRWNYGRDRVALDVAVTGRFAGRYRYVRHGSSVTVVKAGRRVDRWRRPAPALRVSSRL